MGSTSKLCAVALAEVDSSWQEFDILEGKNGLASSILWQWISYAMCGLADMLSERLLWRTWRPRTAQLPATAMAQTGKSPAKAQGPPIQHKRNRVRTRTWWSRAVTLVAPSNISPFAPKGSSGVYWVAGETPPICSPRGCVETQHE